MRSADFLNSLGVNTHVDAPPYDDTLRITTALNYIGFTNIRQSSPIDTASFSGIAALGEAGARIDLIVNGGGPVNLAGAMADIDGLAPYLNAVENVNEAAIYPIRYAGLYGIDAAVALQKDLYSAVRSDPALINVPVYAFTIGGADPAAFPSIGDLSAYTDYANIHSYPPHGLRPIFVIHAAVDGGRTDAPSKPVVLTETGFYTLPNGVGWGGVPESLQASYLLDEVLDEAAAGIARTYLYDLLDDGPDPNGTNQEAHFGLFHADGSPKPAATAFHNLTTLLRDDPAAAAAPSPSSFQFTATGVPYDYTGNTLLLDKADGSHVIAVWNEEQLWDTDALRPIAAQHFPVTVDLHGTADSVLVFDPTVGIAPVQTLHGVDHVDLDLTDHPFLIQVLPPAAVPPPPTPPSSPVPVSDPPATPPPGGSADQDPPADGAAPPPMDPQPVPVSFDLSEDAWLGDAVAVVSLDGQPLGDPVAITAAHVAGETEALLFMVPLDAGPHTATVSFLNDAWGGTPDTDRNLYLDELVVGGRTIPGATATLYSAGSVSFDWVQGPTPDLLPLQAG